MSVVQISRIQHRRGNRDDLPESLAEGELALAKDTGEIFMGAPNLDKIQYRRPGAAKPTGIFPYTNIRLLTEFDVAYNMSDKVYTQGPLLRGVVAPRRVETQLVFQPQDTTSSQNKTATIQRAFVDGAGNLLNETGAVVEQIRLGANVSSAEELDKTKAVAQAGSLTFAYGNAVPKNGDSIWLRYFGNNPFFEFSLKDADTCVIDYSAVAADPWPSVGNIKPRRAGTIHVIADATGAAVHEQGVSLNADSTNPFQVSWNAQLVNPQSQDPRVVVSCVNAGVGPIFVTFSGRRWNGTPSAPFRTTMSQNQSPSTN